jgi:tetratricopeptide (TPR) repeat protein
MSTDRDRLSGVSHSVRYICARRFGVLLLAAALAACGSKDKKEATSPAAGGGGGEAAGGAPAAGGGGGGGEGGQAEEGGGEAGAFDPGPGPQPPGLDLPPEKKKEQVMMHVKRGQEALERANDPNFAIQEAKAALAVDETSVDAMVLLAHANYAKGYYDQVEDVLNKALERNGAKNKKLHFLMGLIHEKNNHPEKALDSYQKAVALDPNYKSAVMNLGVHLLKAKKYQEAANLYERLTGELDMKTAAAFCNLGSAYRGLSAEFTTSDRKKRDELLLKAESQYNKSKNINKNYANAYYNLGLLYLDADPFPQGKDDMDLIKRLQRAKNFFNEYRSMPGADHKLADEQVAVAQKLIDKEERARAKAAEREAKRKSREAKDKAREAKEAKEKKAEPKPEDKKGQGGK